MGKERKPQTGATNLSARNQNAPPPLTLQQPKPSEEPSIEPTNIQRGLAHKLIAPDLYNTNVKEDDSYRKLKVTATWTPLNIYNRDFETTNSDDYRDPSMYPSSEHHSKTTLDIATEAIKDREEVEAINNMCKLVRASYGTVATMLRSVSTI